MADRIELSPSGRSKCRACQKNIEKGGVRLGVSVPNPFGEGEATHYYHLECGAWRQPEALLAAATGVPRGQSDSGDAQPVDDSTQAEAPAPAVEVDRSVWEALPAPQRDSLLAAAELSRQHHRLRRFVKVERAKTARAHCRHCRETIDKGALRLCLEIIEDGRADAAGFVHLGCARAYAGPVEHALPHLARAEGVTEADFSEVERALAAP
jgi:hypothetical protein